MVLAANEHFKSATVVTRVAFFQTKTLNHDVFVQPPKDITETEESIL